MPASAGVREDGQLLREIELDAGRDYQPLSSTRLFHDDRETGFPYVFET